MLRLKDITAAAREHGFQGIAAVRVAEVEEDFRVFYEDYLARGLSADLQYLSRPERFDLRSIWPEANTLLLFLYPYRFRAVEAQLKAAPYKVARYAWQKDYHMLLKEKLRALSEQFNLSGRAVTDSAPLLERYWARRASLGFIGRNGMLIHPETGSYFLIAALLIREPIAPEPAAQIQQGDIPRRSGDFSLHHDFTEFCKDCRLCIEACPTAALRGDGLMDTTRCISYQTIESHEPPVFSAGTKKHRWVFGCDICQQVCPYNKGESAYAEERFNAEHPMASRIAEGEDIAARSELKDSVFFRRGAAKIGHNRDALDRA